MAVEAPILAFPTASAWEAWLEEQHGVSTGIWLKFAKKGSKLPSVTYAEAVEVALCFGWIDGQTRSVDQNWWLQKFTPRRKRSIWSKINREKAEALIRDGRMRPAGAAAVASAKTDGRWEAAYDRQSAATPPDDLREALDRSPAARTTFDGLSAAYRFGIIFRVQTAKRAQTRARRISEFVAKLERGEKPFS
jgi:uncharacterized protein YdeI (YjbR/CyaY-like superfamily)